MGNTNEFQKQCNNDIPNNFYPVGEFLKEMYDDMTFWRRLSITGANSEN